MTLEEAKKSALDDLVFEFADGFCLLGSDEVGLLNHVDYLVSIHAGEGVASKSLAEAFAELGWDLAGTISDFQAAANAGQLKYDFIKTPFYAHE